MTDRRRNDDWSPSGEQYLREDIRQQIRAGLATGRRIFERRQQLLEQRREHPHDPTQPDDYGEPW